MEDPAATSSDGGLPSLSYEDNPSAWSSDGARAKDVCTNAPAAGSSDGGLLSLSVNANPSAWSFDGRVPPCSYDEGPAAKAANRLHCSGLCLLCLH